MTPGFPLFILLTLTPALAQVRISEFLASNQSIPVPGQAGTAFDDWIELENTGSSTANIGGWYLSDSAVDPARWTFPANTLIPPGGFLVIRANGLGFPDGNGILQTNFSLRAEGEYVGLSNSSLAVVSQFGSSTTPYPPQSPDVSFGINPLDQNPVFFGIPTPGGPNPSNGFIDTSEVVFSVGRGYYTSSQTVSLVTADSGLGAKIHFTLDGRPPLAPDGTPAAHATLYTVAIPVTGSRMIRAAATRAGAGPSPVATHSYIFPAGVATQTRPAGYPTSWGSESNADYDVDPDVSQGATDQQRFLDGLRDLPVISVVTDKEDLFGPSGLYSNTLSDLEKKVSAEYFEPAPTGEGTTAGPQFQIDCGMRIQGGASRNPSSAIKHSMSLRFRSDFGAPKLQAAILPPPATDEFNSLHLRAMYNNSWIHSNSDQRKRANLISDQWVRDSYIAMGHDDGVSGRYVHLFLNGLYWGVYNLHERPDNDHYANYSDGVYHKDGVLGLNPGNATSEETQSFNAMKSAVASGDWTAIRQQLDLESYIDYYLIQQFAHNDDLKTNDNWRAAGGGSAGAPWRFYPWDSERTLEDPSNTGPLSISQDGAGIIDDLRELAEFRILLADRAYRHLHHGGALSNSANRQRMLDRVAEIDRAIVGESARWGDDRSGGSGPDGDYTRAENWLPAIHGPLSTQPNGGIVGSGGWFPAAGTSRTDRMIARWKSDGLLPTTDPPQFLVGGSPLHGGLIASGQFLTLSGGTGQIYVTLDGSDPRQQGGSVKPGLFPYTGQPLLPTREGIVKTRWKDGADWSALNEARFATSRLAGPGDLIISELDYHPSDPSAAEILAAAGLPGSPTLTDEDFQFLEILNIASVAVNLENCRLSDGVDFTFPRYQLNPGARMIVVEQDRKFPLRFSLPFAPAGKWANELSKAGEAVWLDSAAGAPIDRFTYNDKSPWPASADGGGHSINRLGTASVGNSAISWTGDLPTPGGGIILDRFASWATVNGLSGIPGADFDQDGSSDFMEYALLLDPRVPDSEQRPRADPSGSAATMTYAVDPGRGDVLVTPFGSTDLNAWTPLTPTAVSGMMRRVSVPGDPKTYFLRLRLESGP